METAIGVDESISLLINNAGTATLAPSLTVNDGAREAMTDVNVTAVVRLSLAMLGDLKREKSWNTDQHWVDAWIPSVANQ